MAGLDDTLSAAIERISAAAFDSDLWLDVLSMLMPLTSSTVAQLVGWEDGEIPSLLILNFDPESLKTWVALGGTQLSNPIVRAGHGLEPLCSVAEHEVMSEEARRRSTLWQEFYEVNEIPHMRVGKAWSDGSRHVMLCAMQDRRRGPMPREEQRVFDLMLQVTGEAVETARIFGADRANLLAGAFDLMSCGVFVLDAFGRVLAKSPEAEHLAQATGLIQIAGGKLRVTSATSQALVDGALARATYAPRGLGEPLASTITVTGESGEGLRLRVMPTPRADYRLPIEACVLVVAECTSDAVQLSAAERAVMLALVSGMRLREIAAERGVSLETVRTQSKAIYAKMGIAGQMDLVLGTRRGRMT